MITLDIQRPPSYRSGGHTYWILRDWWSTYHACVTDPLLHMGDAVSSVGCVHLRDDGRLECPACYAEVGLWERRVVWL